jgi:hypothetical protein
LPVMAVRLAGWAGWLYLLVPTRPRQACLEDAPRFGHASASAWHGRTPDGLAASQSRHREGDAEREPHRLDGVAALLVTTTVECPGQVPPNHQCPLKPPHGDLNCAFPAEQAGRVVQVTGRVRS